MSEGRPFEQLSLAGIAHRCAAETDAFFRNHDYDPRYCYELFRRAMVERADDAYTCLYLQYEALVTSWVLRHSSFRTSGEETQYFVNRAFDKLWSALTPQKFDRFPDLKSLLRYLQMCVHSAVVDHARATARVPVVDSLEDQSGTQNDADEPQHPDRAPTAEESTLSASSSEEFWRQIYQKLNNDRERLVVYASFSLGLKPRELCAQYGDQFANVRDVYRIKQNVLERLRRDPELKTILGEYA